MSLVLFLIVNNWEHKSQRIEFESRSLGYANAVQENIHDYVAALYFIGDFFNNSEQVTRKEYSDFVMSTIARFPDIQAFSWNPLIMNNERAEYEARAQEEGFENFMFTERTEKKELVRAAQRDEYVIVYYIEPLANNKTAFGYDIASNPTRLKAINHGFDTGKLSATDRITLVQETGEQFGILLLLPIYKQNVPLVTMEDRRKHRKGFIVEVLRIGDVIENALKNFSDEGIDVYLYDLSAEQANRFLYYRPSRMTGVTKQHLEKEEIQKGLYWSKTFDLAGRQWQVLFSPSSFYLDSQQSWQAWIVLAGSLLLTGLLAFYMSRKSTYTADIEQRVKKQTQTNLELEKEITERKKAEYGLIKEKEQAKMYFDIVGVILVAINTDQRVILINKKGCEILGYSEKDVIGQNWFDFFIPDNERKRVKEVFDLLMRGELEPVEYYENQIITKSKQLRTIAWHNSFLYDDKGRITGTLSSGEDITDRKRMEEELQRGHKLESIGILAGGIAHDFNNLLTAITNNVYLTQQRVDRDSSAFHQLEQVVKAVSKATNLTDQLLTFSRGGTPIKETASITDIINESINFILRGSNVRCEYNLPDDLWAVEVDAGQISQVIQNLVINADQSMPDGGTICVYGENVVDSSELDLPLHQGKYVKIKITDHGEGISEENLQKLFDPFFTTKDMGRGLGLSVTYSIIKRHEGHIEVESMLGKGATFTIYLPASKDTISTEKSDEIKFLEGEGRLLIMDDDKMVRDSMGQILSAAGYHTDFAMDGDEAIEMFENARKSSYPFDIVILDLTVPGGMGGKETIKKLIKIDPETRAIVSSGYSSDPVMSDFKAYGFRDFIAKPYKPDELIRVLHEVING